MIQLHSSLTADLPDSPAGWEELLEQLFGPRLSERQRQVAARRCLGYTDAEIAADLGISAATVRAHDTHILAKLHLNSVHQIPVCCFSLLWQRFLRVQREVDRKIVHRQRIDEASNERRNHAECTAPRCEVLRAATNTEEAACTHPAAQGADPDSGTT